MSRSAPTKQYIGVDKPAVEVSVEEPIHWYAAWLLGYRAKAWPKTNDCVDDDRFNLKEMESL